jgi:hypothetical protein
MTNQQIILNGLTGLAASTFSVITTFQEQLEWWVRISGGLLGILVALVSVYRLLFAKPRKP